VESFDLMQNILPTHFVCWNLQLFTQDHIILWGEAVSEGLNVLIWTVVSTFYCDKLKQLTVYSFVKIDLNLFHNKFYFGGSCCNSVWVADNELIPSKVIEPVLLITMFGTALVFSGPFSSPINVNHFSHLHGGTLRTYSTFLILLLVRVSLLPDKC
jgi:hypothetical protein